MKQTPAYLSRLISALSPPSTLCAAAAVPKLLHKNNLGSFGGKHTDFCASHLQILIQ